VRERRTKPGVERGGVNDVLARASIFQGIAPDAVAALDPHLQRVALPRRHTVFVEGERGDELYVIVAGAVKIRHQTPDGRETVFAVLGPGDVFGELALFDPGPRTSTVITLTEVDAVRMDRQALRRWIVERPEIAEQLLRVLARRLRHTNNTLCDLIFTDVPARVAKQILDLAMRFGTSIGGSVRVEHHLTQKELAQLVGSSRETVNKALSDFTQRGWIRQQGKSLIIDEPEKLARRARA
jgi:CRP/FNR family transcriptional regulator, cyclic AMP receptor protein